MSTRWYRSPELLAGDANYDETVDVWAAGCLLPEISNGMPLFPGESDVHTLELILKAFGNKLTEKQRTAFVENPYYKGVKLPQPTERESLEERYAGIL